MLAYYDEVLARPSGRKDEGIDDMAKLREIRKAVLVEQKKPDGGVFAETVLTKGYWANNFCSATISSLIKFKTR